MRTFFAILVTLFAMAIPAKVNAQDIMLDLTRVDGDELKIVSDILGNSGGVISGDFTADGKGRFVSVDFLQNYTVSVKIYDEDFNIASSMILQMTLLQDDATSMAYDYGYVDFKVRYLAKTGFATESWVSQTLFNSDERYEVIVPLYDDHFTSLDGGPINRKYVNGFGIINDMGQTVCQGKFKTKYWHIDKAFVLIMGERKYLYFDDGYGNSDCFLIESGKSSLKRVELPKGLKAVPNVSRASEMVSLTFPEAAETRTLSLVNTSGRVVRTDRIAAGTDTYGLNTGSLSPGLYVVTLSDGTTTIETAKIIIR